MPSLSDRLKKEKADSIPGRVAFLESADEIAEAINNGWTKRLIWEQLKEDGLITVDYRRFIQLCKQYLSTDDKETTVTKPNTSLSDKGKKIKEKAKKSKGTSFKGNTTVRPKSADEVDDKDLY